jgi:hypothetical protein
MTVIIDGTAGIANNATDLSYTGTLTGSTGVVNIGSGQVYKDASGNVGIGTSLVNAKAQIQVGDVMPAASGNMNTGMVIQQGGAGQALNFGSSSTNAYSWINSAYSNNSGIAAPLVLMTGATERARIDSSGNLLVGTTTNLASTAKMSVYNTGGGSGGMAIGYGSTFGQFRVMYLLSGNGGLYFDNGTNAALLNSAGAWTNASDARLKNSITDIKYGLSAVLSTQPRSYKMNDLEGDYFGFIAQELQTVLPEVISGDPEKQLGVDYGSLVAVAFKAIQELKAIVDTQAARITALEAK